MRIVVNGAGTVDTTHLEKVKVQNKVCFIRNSRTCVVFVWHVSPEQSKKVDDKILVYISAAQCLVSNKNIYLNAAPIVKTFN